jgi:hypothetical protein
VRRAELRRLESTALLDELRYGILATMADPYSGPSTHVGRPGARRADATVGSPYVPSFGVIFGSRPAARPMWYVGSQDTSMPDLPHRADVSGCIGSAA